MYVGMVLLIIVAILVLFGVGQRVLDKLRLTDRQALLFIALTVAGGFVPEIPLGDMVRINIGGFLVPLGLCVFLFIKAEGAGEYARAIASALLSGAAVWVIGAYFPNEPEVMPFDVNYLYGIVAGLIACVLGRSRRAAFIGGTLGVILADVAVAVTNWADGIPQALVLGGAGAFDAIVIAGLLAVLVRELVGEIQERITRRTGQPERTFAQGDIVPKDEPPRQDENAPDGKPPRQDENAPDGEPAIESDVAPEFVPTMQAGIVPEVMPTMQGGIVPEVVPSVLSAHRESDAPAEEAGAEQDEDAPDAREAGGKRESDEHGPPPSDGKDEHDDEEGEGR